MFRDDSFPTDKHTLNVLLADGGLGDHICALVAVKYIVKNYTWLNALVWVPNYLLDFAKHVLPENTVVRDYSKAEKKYNDKLPGVTTKWLSQHTPMRTHPVDYAFHMLADIHLYTNEDKNYPRVDHHSIDISRYNLPKKYIAIAATSAEKVKRFKPGVITAISEYVKNLGYTPVYLGKTEVIAGKGPKIMASEPEDDLSIGINLIDQTDVLESAAVIAGAKAFVGMDGGLVHVAGCTDTPIVACYTFIDPNHNLPIRNNTLGFNCLTVLPNHDLACRFCQTNWGLLFNHDFRECKYLDFKCTDQITIDKIKYQLEKIL